MTRRLATWTCPLCHLDGQVSSANPARTSLGAHLAVVHPDVTVHPSVMARLLTPQPNNHVVAAWVEDIALDGIVRLPSS